MRGVLVFLEVGAFLVFDGFGRGLSSGGFVSKDGKKPREKGEPPSANILIYNPPKRGAPWSIESPIYVR